MRTSLLICFTLFTYTLLYGFPPPPLSPLDFDKLPTVQWKFKINAPIFSSPVINEGIAYFGALDSTVYALDLKSGAIKWKLKTNGEIRSTLVVQNGRIYLVGGNGVFTCIDKNTGKAVWRSLFDNTAVFLAERKYDFADYYYSTPVVLNNVIYFGSGNGHVNAIKAENGEVIWTFKAGDIVHSSPVIYKDKIFFGSFDGYLYALSRQTGNLIWKFKSVGHTYFPQGEMQGDPVVANGLVYLGSRDFNIYAVDAERGFAHWNRRFLGGWALSNTVKDTVLYVGTSDDRVMLALDARDGRELWKTNVKFNIFGSCAFTPTMAYVGTIWGKLYGIDQKSGAIKWAFQTDGYNQNHDRYYKADDSFRDDIGSIFQAPADWVRGEYKMGGIFSTPAIAGDSMVVTTTEGTVYCLKK